MKNYTFTIGNTNKTNTTPSTNYSAIIDDIIRTNIKKANPYLFSGTIDADYMPTAKRTMTDINITIRKNRKKTFGGIGRTITNNMFKYADLAKTIDRLAKRYDSYFAEFSTTDDYDFLLDDGTPVKLFADEIQIGYDIIPLNNFTKAIYDSLSEKNRKNIIDIYIKINKD